jgi:replication initiation and membrane attachment protein
MVEAWRQINPQSQFILIAENDISDLQRVSLDTLYQPIIGSLAYTLINVLWRMRQANRFHTKPYSNFDLLSTLNIDIKTLYNTRLRLEAAGLMKTFVKNGDTNQAEYVYRLISPLDYRGFFQDDLLSVTLLQSIGENQYINLVKSLVPSSMDLSGYQDVSKNFLEVFNVKQSEFTQTPEVINQVNLNVKSDTGTVTPDVIFDDDFDFNLLITMLEKSFVNIDDVKKSAHLIQVEHQLYGIDEIETSRLIEKATNLVNNVFDPNKFKMLVSRQFQQTQIHPLQIDENNLADDNSVQSKLNHKELQLSQSAKKYAPVAFLEGLKKGKGGFVHSNEERLLSEFINRHLLNTEVINMISYHILVDQEKASLNKNLFDTIADNWSQNKISTAEQAIKFISDRKKQKTSSQQKYTKKYKNHVKENLPDWAQDDYQNHKATNKVDKKKQQALADKIKNLRMGK